MEDDKITPDDDRTKLHICSLDVLIYNMESLLDSYGRGPDADTAELKKKIAGRIKTYDRNLVEVRSEEDDDQALKICNELVDYFKKCLKEHEYEAAKDIVNQAMNRVELKDHRQYNLVKLYFNSLKVWNDSQGDEQSGKNIHEDDKQFKKNVYGVMAEILKQAVILREEYKPTTIEEAFHQWDWPAMKEMYESQKGSLSKEKLNLVAILAANKRSWEEFHECLKYGADIVKTKQATPHVKSSSSSSHTDEVCLTVTGCSGIKHINSTSALSPLHEALKTGGFLLENVKSYFEKDTELVNAVNAHGDSLLHAAVGADQTETRVKNVQFLLEQDANINVQDATGIALLQSLVHPRTVNLMMELVNGAANITDESWRPGHDGWTALHALCASGRHDQLLQFVQKGANPRDLRKGMTLVDTAILGNTSPSEDREITLTVLLKEPLALGPYHVHVVEQRGSSMEQNEGLPFFFADTFYRLPLEYLLVPPISTHAVRQVNKKLIELLLDNGAVCEQEMGILRSKLPSADQEYQELGKRLGVDVSNDQTDLS